MLNWKAIVIGAAVDFIGTEIASYLLVFLWAAALKLQGVADGDLPQVIGHSALFHAVAVTVGWYFDFLGGHFAGRVAKQHGWQHGLAAATPGVILAVFETAQQPDPMFPAWFMAACCAVSLICGCYGSARAVQGLQSEAS